VAKLQPMTHRIPIAAARKQLASVLARTKDGDRIKLTRYDKTIAAIIPKKDLEKLRECEADDETEAEVAVKPKSK
jgi:prevent-host-death family protein